MRLPDSLIERLSKEVNCSTKPAPSDLVARLQERNADGDVLDYFRLYNFEASVDCVCLDAADANLQMMDDTCPNCEVWQHGFIPFGRDLEGRCYCFNQNDRDSNGNSKIVRLSYPFGDDTSVEQISSASEFIAPDFATFLSLYLDSKVDSM
jgi:hypothetical protein